MLDQEIEIRNNTVAELRALGLEMKTIRHHRLDKRHEMSEDAWKTSVTQALRELKRRQINGTGRKKRRSRGTK